MDLDTDIDVGIDIDIDADKLIQTDIGITMDMDMDTDIDIHICVYRYFHCLRSLHFSRFASVPFLRRCSFLLLLAPLSLPLVLLLLAVQRKSKFLL